MFHGSLKPVGLKGGTGKKESHESGHILRIGKAIKPGFGENIRADSKFEKS